MFYLLTKLQQCEETILKICTTVLYDISDQAEFMSQYIDDVLLKPAYYNHQKSLVIGDPRCREAPALPTASSLIHGFCNQQGKHSFIHFVFVHNCNMNATIVVHIIYLLNLESPKQICFDI